MNVYLLNEDSEFSSKDVRMNKNDVIKDLNLEIIFKFMARNDNFIYRVARSVITGCLCDKRTILYRQALLEDCIVNYEIFYELYKIASDAISETEQFMESTRKSSSAKISNSVNVLHSLELLGILVRNLEKLKEYADSVEMNFSSSGMRAFYNRLISEYNYNFVGMIKTSIEEMGFLTEGGEITFSAALGSGLKMGDITVNSLAREEYKKSKSRGIISIMYYKLFKKNVLLLEDDSIKRDAREMEAAGLVHILKLYQSFIRELTSLFENLRFQLAFYIGGANLRNRLLQIRIPVCFPQIDIKGSDGFKFTGLYDLSLAIYTRTKPVTNDLDAEDKLLYVITGANQGGKSTFLRSIGIAQILMQSGMFVPADSFTSKLYDGIFTHFTRREDTAMNSGKLDEELGRMSRIINEVTPDSLLLLNESFSTTTEREGTMIALDVINALYENKTNIVMVTHLYEFTRTLYGRQPEKALFLSAQRLEDGTRTYKMIIREPERTSYGLDLYKEIIGEQCDKGTDVTV